MERDWRRILRWKSLRVYRIGGFVNLGFDGSSGWVHSDVKSGNTGSEGVMMSLGGTIGWVSSYTWIDADKF